MTTDQFVNGDVQYTFKLTTSSNEGITAVPLQSSQVIKIKVEQKNGLLQPTETIMVAQSAVNNNKDKLTDLIDVISVNPQDNEVLTYDSNTHKYTLEPIILDGGTF